MVALRKAAAGNNRKVNAEFIAEGSASVTCAD